MSDTQPINDKIDQILSADLRLMASGKPTTVYVAAVDFISGEIFYVDPSQVGFLSYLKGSIAIPVIMPASVVLPHSDEGLEILFDGGVREVAPLGKAINDGAKDIIAVACQVESLAADGAFQQGNIMSVAERAMDIVVNQNVNNDVKFIGILNEIIKEAEMAGVSLPSLQKYGLINHTIIRPQQPLPTSIQSFTMQDIIKGINIGYETAQQALSTSSVLASA